MIIRRYLAFTLVEVLTAMAIIAVLAGLVFVLASSSIRSGKSTQCATQLAQIGLATQLYAEDHDGYVPPYEFRSAVLASASVITADGPSLRKALRLYGVVESQFFCPLDWLSRKKAEEGWVDNRESSYEFSGSRFKFGETTHDWVSFKISSVPYPSRTKHLFDSGHQPGVDKEETTGHGKMRNVLYFDGHVVAEDVTGPFCHWPGQNTECPE